MTDMHELRSIEHLLVFLAFYIGTYETAHPIVSDDD